MSQKSQNDNEDYNESDDDNETETDYTGESDNDSNSDIETDNSDDDNRDDNEGRAQELLVAWLEEEIEKSTTTTARKPREELIIRGYEMGGTEEGEGSGSISFSATDGIPEPFRRIKKLVLENNKIAHVRNLPPTLIYFHCSHNKLKTIPEAEHNKGASVGATASNIEEIHVPFNSISHIRDLSAYSKLKVLHLENNAIAKIGKLPASLEELYLDNNDLTELDINGLPNLRILHINHNTELKNIYGFPKEGIADFQYKNNPLHDIHYENEYNASAIDIKKKQETKQLDYSAKLREFFQLKSKYERDNAPPPKRTKDENKKKKTKKAKKVSCPRCLKKGGMEFTITAEQYALKCKAPLSCIEMVLDRSVNYSLYEIIKENSEKQQELETRILEQKYNSIFNYKSNHKIVADFKKTLEEYERILTFSKLIMDKYIDFSANDKKQEIIDAKIKEVEVLLSEIQTNLYTISKTDTDADTQTPEDYKQVITTVVEIQKTKIAPLMANIHEMVEKETDIEKLHSFYYIQPSVQKYDIAENIDTEDNEEEELARRLAPAPATTTKSPTKQPKPTAPKSNKKENVGTGDSDDEDNDSEGESEEDDESDIENTFT